MKLPFIPIHREVIYISAASRPRLTAWQRFERQAPTWLVSLARALACFSVTVFPLVLAGVAKERFGWIGVAVSGAGIVFGWLYAVALAATRRERRVRPNSSSTLRRVA